MFTTINILLCGIAGAAFNILWSFKKKFLAYYALTLLGGLISLSLLFSEMGNQNLSATDLAMIALWHVALFCVGAIFGNSIIRLVYTKENSTEEE